MNVSFTEHARKKLRYIHGLSEEYNGLNKEHTEVLLELVEKHDLEIRKLYEQGDAHFLTEVGDLLILCMEIIIEQKKDLDGILDKCYGRYEKKLEELISARKKN